MVYHILQNKFRSLWNFRHFFTRHLHIYTFNNAIPFNLSSSILFIFTFLVCGGKQPEQCVRSPSATICITNVKRRLHRQAYYFTIIMDVIFLNYFTLFVIVTFFQRNIIHRTYNYVYFFLNYLKNIVYIFLNNDFLTDNFYKTVILIFFSTFHILGSMKVFQ